MELSTPHLPHTSFPLQSHFTWENELAERVRRFLHNQGIDAKNLTIESTGGSVVLRGELSSTTDKRLCLECSRRVAGVIRVIDELHLAEPKWKTRPK